MGKKAKVGKARKDKFYRLAKETGYRSRAAFKLIQLNRKFEFLEKSRVVVDLCAAPGGWLQVAAENTPVSSLVLGVDLVSIRPINKCSTFQADITTEKCRQILRQELKTWKADVFLNDGAPNVGKNWIHDAYQQAELTLHALKLSTEFLKKGGWFVTKVFRSKDYYSLLWVFQQLFGNVHATKPQASRNESAEIFVVCQGYLAPDRIDPKFLNPKHVFKDVESAESRSLLDLDHPEKRKRNREGYEEGDYTQYHKILASEFLATENFLPMLAGASEVALDKPAIANHKSTTPEIKECLKDIKVLGKKDIKSIITWRKKLKEELKLTGTATQDVSSKEDKTESEDRAESSESDVDIDEKLQQLEERERHALKRKLKKTRREKTKLQHRMDLKMVLPNDAPDITDDRDIFSLKKIKNKKHLDTVDEGEELEWEDEEDLPPPAKRRTVLYDRDLYEHYDRDDVSDEEYDSDPELQENDEKAEELKLEEEQNPLVVDLQRPATKISNKINSWFSKSSFADVEDEADEDAEIEQLADRYRKKGGRVTGQAGKEIAADVTAKAEEEEQPPETANSDSSDSDSDSDYDTNQLMETDQPNVKNESTKKKDGFEVVPNTTPGVKLDAVGMAIGAAMVQSQRRKRDIIDNAYHRYMFDDDGLPDWFSKDEAKHNHIQLPVTKGDVQEYREKMKAVDARPIKKIAEAKGRKKKKELRRLQRARKRAEVVSDATEVSDKEKWQQIKQIYKKAGLLHKKKKEIQYVVAKKGIGKRVHRPSGVNGPFRVVDKRLKKDKAAQKRQESKQKGKKRQKGKR